MPRSLMDPLTSRVAAMFAIALNLAPSSVAATDVAPPFDLSASFTQLGGSSIMAMRLVSRLRSVAPSLAIAQLFAHPSVNQLVAFLRANRMLTPQVQAEK